MTSIDLNCDLAEGFPNDEALMPYISSANMACGFHAGDETTIRKTIQLAVAHDVALGAHPSFPDKTNFGRKDLDLPAEKIYDIVAHQVVLLEKLCKEEGAVLRHVKPHGALYNMAAKKAEIAGAIARAIYDVNKGLILYGLSGSISIIVARNLGLTTASEVFADRSYQDDGSLTPRPQPGAIIEDQAISIKQVLQMVVHKKVTSLTNKILPITAETICLHGDGKHAVEFAKLIHQTLRENGILITTL